LLAEKAALKYKHLPHRERMAKISQTLLRRGFDWEVTGWVLRQLSSDEWLDT
jgi:SOS response regulatory protein OraA/RecX